jgi:succinyl-diaminopimelate desuccinylase
MTDELVALATRLIGYDTSEPEGVLEAAGFVEGWLEARGIEVATEEVRGLPVLKAEVGPEEAPTVVLHGHLDVVPARRAVRAAVEGDRLYGRGAYDMKGALAAMLLTTAAMREQDRVRVRLGVVGDEESEEEPSAAATTSSTAASSATSRSPASRPTSTSGRGEGGAGAAPRGGRGSRPTAQRPWLGDNAVLRALDVFRSIESLPFARQSSELFDRPSINLGRILGGDALNKVPDRCAIDVDIRYLPDQDPAAVLAEVRGIGGAEVEPLFTRPPRGGRSATWPTCRRCDRRSPRTTTASR